MKASVFLLMILFLASCESDQLATSNNSTLEKKLVLNPTRLEGEQYKSYTLKAKLTNVPVSDLFFYWDLDEGKGFSHTGWIVNPIFYENKVHQVRVKVLDGFTDSLLAYDSIRADIRPPVALVEISPKTIDTLLVTNADGSMAQELWFKLNTSTPANLIRTEWDFGDGSPVVADNSSHRFLRAGTFTVRVKVFEKTGLYVGSDSAHVTIRMPEVHFSEIANSRGVVVALSIENSHPVSKIPGFINPLICGLMNIGKNSLFADFQSPKFVVRLDYEDQNVAWHDTIAGELSPDMMKIKTLQVVGMDTSFNSQPTHVRFNFVLHDLELLAVTTDKIVYRSISETLSDFVSDLSFVPPFQGGTAGGVTGIPGIGPELKAPPCAIVIFFK
jgi:hypothetical protein